MFSVIKNKKGATLIELMVTMVISAIIMAAVGAVLIPTFVAYSKANDIAENTTIINNIATEITNDISRASKVSVVGDELSLVVDSGNIVSYKVKNGMLVQGNGDALVFQKEYYKKRTIIIKYKDFDHKVGYEYAEVTDVTKNFIVDITIYDNDGNKMFSQEFGVKPLILNQY